MKFQQQNSLDLGRTMRIRKANQDLASSKYCKLKSNLVGKYRRKMSLYRQSFYPNFTMYFPNTS